MQLPPINSQLSSKPALAEAIPKDHWHKRPLAYKDDCEILEGDHAQEPMDNAWGVITQCYNLTSLKR